MKIPGSTISVPLFFWATRRCAPAARWFRRRCGHASLAFQTQELNRSVFLSRVAASALTIALVLVSVAAALSRDENLAGLKNSFFGSSAYPI